jgi:aryl-alcohol dehydrogenase-like predicted oxidoreductase
MRYRTLGRTGIEVSILCLGTMLFGTWGNADPASCREIVDLALHAGVNFFDTADVYDQGRSEEILGASLAGRRDEVVLATKFHHQMGQGRNASGNSRRWIARAVEASLARLGTDWIDLYQIHRPDHSVEIEETVDALSNLVRQGKIRAYGTSNFPADEIVDAQWVARSAGLVRPATEQPPYSVLARGVERDVLPACERHGIGVLAWSPLNGGWLTGKYRRGEVAPEGSRAATHGEHFDFESASYEAKLDAVERLEALADAEGHPLHSIALAWVTEHPAVTSAIIGPRTPGQAAELLAHADLRLSPELLGAIDEIVPPGKDLNPGDAAYIRPELEAAARRRPR